MPANLTLFRVTGLHGRKDISVPIIDNKLVLVGENGTGKSTVVNLMFYFLTRQWNRLSQYQFTSLEAVVSGESLEVTPQLMSAFVDYTHHLRNVTRHLLPHMRYSVAELAVRLGPDIDFRALLDDREQLQRFALESELPVSLAREFLMRASKEVASPDVAAFQQVSDRVAALMSEEFLYLPTYRRIEQDLKSIFPGTEIEAEIKKFRERMAHRSPAGYTELVAFGMEDVERTIAERMSAIKDGVRKELNNLTGTYLRDVLQGAHSSVDIGRVRELDQATLNSIFARIDETTLPRGDQERLRTKVADMSRKTDIDSDERVIAHFLSKLMALYKDQQAKEADVREFVSVCNTYLTEKALVYDDVKYEIHIQPMSSTTETGSLSLRVLSSGEKQIVSLFSHIYLTGRQFFVIIDEPELSLSVPWQRQFLPDILRTGQCTGLVAVTHSPFIWENDLEPYVRSIAEYTKRAD